MCGASRAITIGRGGGPWRVPTWNRQRQVTPEFMFLLIHDALWPPVASPEKWNALAAFLQFGAALASAVFAYLIYRVTNRYVGLTGAMLENQIEPRIALTANGPTLLVLNVGVIPVFGLQLRTTAIHHSPPAIDTVLEGGPNLELVRFGAFKPGDQQQYDFAKILEFIGRDRISHPERARGGAAEYRVIIEATYLRRSDGKKFPRKICLPVRWLPDGEPWTAGNSDG
jgi:hypothetical protein